MVLPRRSIPSISGLIAFEATARQLSFSKAATELSLTQGAISKRISRLEEVLGVELITRDAHHISLTSVGEVYLRQVQSQLVAMERSISDVVNQAAGVAAVTVSAPTLFALNWLIPLLTKFRADHPDIQISIHSSDAAQPPNLAHLDGQITLEQGSVTKPNAFELFAEDLLAVATPELLQRHSITGAETLPPNIMLHLSNRKNLWADWYRTQAVVAKDFMAGPVYANSTMLLHAAKCGLGIALLPQFSVAEDLKNGTLARVGNTHPLSEYSYWFHSPSVRKLSSSGQTFAHWIARQSCHRQATGDLKAASNYKDPLRGGDILAS